MVIDELGMASAFALFLEVAIVDDRGLEESVCEETENDEEGIFGGKHRLDLVLRETVTVLNWIHLGVIGRYPDDDYMLMVQVGTY